MKRLELREQIIHLILERKLREYADGVGIAQTLFEPLEV